MTTLDLHENIAALVVAIMRDDVISADDAFEVMNNPKKRNKKGMNKIAYELREQGISCREIAEILGLSLSTVMSYVSGEKKRREMMV